MFGLSSQYLLKSLELRQACICEVHNLINFISVNEIAILFLIKEKNAGVRKIVSILLKKIIIVDVQEKRSK